MKLRYSLFAAGAVVLMSIGQATQAADAYLISDSKGDDICCDDSNWGANTVYGDLQFLYLKTFGTEESFGRGLNSQGGVRFVTGIERPDGLGLRVRYLNFDGTDAINPPSPNLDGLELEYFDLEITETFSICNINGVVSAGYRHAEYNAYTTDPVGNPDEGFIGDGVTFGVQAQRDLNDSLALFGWVQHSMLYGDDEGRNDVADTVMGWTEVQLGVQVTRCMNGRTIVIRTGAEAQRHEGMFDDDTQDTGLIGWFVSGGIVF